MLILLYSSIPCAGGKLYLACSQRSKGNKQPWWKDANLHWLKQNRHCLCRVPSRPFSRRKTVEADLPLPWPRLGYKKEDAGTSLSQSTLFGHSSVYFTQYNIPHADFIRRMLESLCILLSINTNASSIRIHEHSDKVTRNIQYAKKIKF